MIKEIYQKEKIELYQSSDFFEQKSDNRFELAEKFIKISKQAKIIA